MSFSASIRREESMINWRTNTVLYGVIYKSVMSIVPVVPSQITGAIYSPDAASHKYVGFLFWERIRLVSDILRRRDAALLMETSRRTTQERATQRARGSATPRENAPRRAEKRSATQRNATQHHNSPMQQRTDNRPRRSCVSFSTHIQRVSVEVVFSTALRESGRLFQQAPGGNWFPFSRRQLVPVFPRLTH